MDDSAPVLAKASRPRPGSWLLWALPLYALAHLGTLTTPPLGRDAWRESDVLMVGRNFCTEHTPLWAPRIDQRGSGVGITGMELPLLNAVDGGLSCLGFDQVFVARTITLLFALLGIASLARLAALFLEPIGAAVAVLTFAASPLIFYYGRAVQPDVPALALALLSLSLLESSLRGPKLAPGRVLGAALAMGLALLIKLPAIVFGLPAIWLVLRRFRWREAAGQPWLWLFAVVSLVPALAWYHHARVLQDEYGLHYFYLGSSWRHLWDAWTSGVFYRRIFVEQLFDVYAFPLSAGLAVLAFLGWRKVPGFVRALTLGCVAFLFLAGFQASHHFYYGVLVTPAVALGAGAGVDRFGARLGRYRGWALGALCVGIVAWAPWRCARWFPKPGDEVPLQAAARLLDHRAPPDQRILVLSRGDPKLLWFLDRKGWVGPASDESTWLLTGKLHPPAVVLDDRRLPAERVARIAPALVQLGYAKAFADTGIELWLR